eukprot:1177245-Prorocentrum_minimum.AAC.3
MVTLNLSMLFSVLPSPVFTKTSELHTKPSTDTSIQAKGVEVAGTGGGGIASSSPNDLDSQLTASNGFITRRGGAFFARSSCTLLTSSTCERASHHMSNPSKDLATRGACMGIDID